MMENIWRLTMIREQQREDRLRQAQAARRAAERPHPTQAAAARLWRRLLALGARWRLREQPHLGWG